MAGAAPVVLETKDITKVIDDLSENADRSPPILQIKDRPSGPSGQNNSQASTTQDKPEVANAFDTNEPTSGLGEEYSHDSISSHNSEQTIGEDTHEASSDGIEIEEEMPVLERCLPNHVPGVHENQPESKLQYLSEFPLPLVTSPSQIKIQNSLSPSQSPLSSSTSGTPQPVDASIIKINQHTAREHGDTPLSAGFTFNPEQLQPFVPASTEISTQSTSPDQCFQDGVVFYNQLGEHQQPPSPSSNQFPSGSNYEPRRNEPTKTFSNLVPSPTIIASNATIGKAKTPEHDQGPISHSNNNTSNSGSNLTIHANNNQDWSFYNNHVVSASSLIGANGAGPTVASTVACTGDYASYQQYFDYARQFPNAYVDSQRLEVDGSGHRTTTDLQPVQQYQTLSQQVFTQQGFVANNFTHSDKFSPDNDVAGKTPHVAARLELDDDQTITSHRLKLLRSIPADPLSWTSSQARTWLDVMLKTLCGPDNADVDDIPDVTGRELCNMAIDDLTKYIRSNHVAEKLFTELTLRRKSFLSGQNTAESPGPSYSRGNTDSSSFSAQNAKSDGGYGKSWTSQPSSPQGFGSHSPSFGKAGFESHAQWKSAQVSEAYHLLGPISARLSAGGSGQIQLWQFLLELLSDSNNQQIIQWEGTNGEFKLSDPDEVARKWGERKSKPSMNYDKMSRALRYYYDKHIMTKVHGKRYAYKFDFNGIAQATQPPPPDHAYKYQPEMLMTAAAYPAPKYNFMPPSHAGLPSSSSPGLFGPSNHYPWSSTASGFFPANISSHTMSHGHLPSHIPPYY